MGFTDKYVIGLDMDSQEIRAVELKGNQKSHVVTAWGRVRLPEGVVTEGRIVDPKAFSIHLERLGRENGFKGRKVVLGVNNQDIIVRFATFPKVLEKNIKSMIQFQAQEHIPVPLEELELDYIVLGEKTTDEGEFLNVLLVGARKKMLNDFIEAFTLAGLSISEIDSTMLALGRAALIESHDGTFALAGFNHDIGNILIFKDGLLGMARTVSIVQSPVWISSRKAEKQSNEQDMRAIADILFSEIRLSVNYYKMQSNENISNLFVLGHNSSQSQVAERLKETTGLSVQVPAPYKNMTCSRRGIGQRFDTLDYCAGISLALRGLRK